LRQGEGEARTFLVESGWGIVHRDLSTGARQIVEIPISGDLVGHFTHRGPRHESFSSVTDLRVWEGSASAFSAALADTSFLGEFVYSSVARQRSLLGERLADIGQRSAAVRATHFLLELGLRLERIGAASCDNYYCPLTQSVLADTLGLTAIHLNRTLRETREAGLFQFRRGHVEFLGYEAAVSFAQFDGSYLQG
jgi:CRP-like cAMP-binding protein